MAIFYGTNGTDDIRSFGFTPGVTSDPPGLTAVTVGDDILFGYGGDDYLDGGDGSDTVFGGNGDDYISDSADSVASHIYGGAGDDYMWSDGAQVYIEGGSGRDTMSGDWSDDTMLGGTGGDEIVLLGGNDRGFGGAGADFVHGGWGDDFVSGGAGDDTLEVGGLNDTLIGGSGNDVFRFYVAFSDDVDRASVIRAAYNSDVPAFEGAGAADGDVIDLSLLGYAAGVYPLVFGGTGEGHVRLVDSGARTLVLANLEGDAAPEFRLAIDDGAGVRAQDYTADDFIL